MAKKKTPGSRKDEATSFLEEDLGLVEQYGKAEQYILDNKGLVLGIVGAIALLTILIFGFRSIYLPGQNKAALEDMFMAQQYFEKDSFNLALNGDGSYSGFVDVISDYSGMTDAVNLANYYAGICNLNLGNFQEAIDYLSSFSGKDKIVSSMALGAMGDAYMELGNESNGLSYYKKAAYNSDNNFSSAMFLMKAGAATEKSGDFAGALKFYNDIKSKYPESAVAADIDKYIARASAKK